MSFIVAVALALGTFISVSAKGGTQSTSLAAGRVYFVSNAGSDTNAGTASAPFKTFSKAMSVLAAGDELQIYGGTYTQQLNVNKSGTSSAPISIKAVPGQQVIIDGGGSNDQLVFVPDGTSYVKLSDLTCKNASVVCVLLRGSHITVTSFDVSGGKKFGVRLTGSYITVENSSIHDNVLENVNGTNTTAGWGSALRSAQGSGSNNIFRNNEVFHNWGEGIIMGSNTSQVYGNSVHDNYSKNIYIGNTYGVDVYQNVTYSTDSKWFRSGSPADCISLSEELINSTYGAQLGNIRVFNNIASNCKTGVGYTYTELSGNGCNNCLFAFNTVTASKSACIKVIDGSKNHVEIADNICSAGSISVPSGDISVHNNVMGDAHLAGGPIGDPNSYRPLSSSCVIGAGVNVGISTDYFGIDRSPYDVGSIQAGAKVQPTAILPSPTPIVVLPSPTPIVPTVTPIVILPSPTPVIPTATPIEVLPSPTFIPTATPVVTLAPPSPTAPAPVTATSQPPSIGAQAYDDKNAIFAYSGSWEETAATKAYGGSFRKSMVPGQSVSMTFTGSSFSILYTKNSTFGKMDVLVDGVLVGTIDQYASSRKLQQTWDLPIKLAPGKHTLKLVHAGTDRTTRVSLDAVTVYP